MKKYISNSFEKIGSTGGFLKADGTEDTTEYVGQEVGKSLVLDTEISKLAILDATADIDKPVSTATQTELDLKAPLASPTFTGTVSGITKTMVGLGNVDNTSDLNKPVSTATQTAIQAQLVDSTLIGGVTTSSSVPPTGNIHAIGVGAGTYPNWGGMIVPANNFGTPQRVGGVYSVSLTAITGLDLKSDKIVSENKISGISFTNGKYLINGTGSEGTFTDLCYTNLISLEGISAIKSVIYTLGDSASYVLYDADEVVINAPVNLNDSISTPETIYIPIRNNEKFIRFVTSIAQQSSFFADAVSLKTDELETLETLTKVIKEKQNIITEGIVVQTSSYFDSNGVIQNYADSPNDFNVTLDYIDVKDLNDYILNKNIEYGNMIFYDVNKNMLSHLAFSSTVTNFSFSTPANCRYIRTTYFKSAGIIILNNDDAYIIEKAEKTIVIPNPQGISSLGSLETEPLAISDYSHIIFNGQSLSVGAVSIEPISTTPLTDCFMTGVNVETFSGTLTPLRSQVIGNSGEQPIVGAVNSFKKYLNKTSFRNTKLIASSVGTGGVTVEQLSKNRLESDGLTTNNLYHTKFLPALDSALDSVGASNITCSAIVYMQGEANQVSSGTVGLGLTTSLAQCTDKATYKTLLKQLKNDMQADVIAKYGQSLKPLFFVYQTSAFYTVGNIPISQAQFELSQEEEDIILLNPHYYCPTAQDGSGHLNANGYRWFGEQVSKTLYNSLVENKNFNPVTPKKFTIDKNNILIDCYVPVLPLVIDTKAINIQTGYGFTVKLNGVTQAVSNIEIIGGSVIKLSILSDLSTGTVDVSYGGNEQVGKGNIHDSDTYFSFSNYVNDTTLTSNNPPYTPLDSNGVNFYGKKYPLWNWLSNFYINIQS